MYASKSHIYTHLILALGIVSEPTVWVFITSKYSGTHDIGLPSTTTRVALALLPNLCDATLGVIKQGGLVRQAAAYAGVRPRALHVPLC